MCIETFYQGRKSNVVLYICNSKILDDQIKQWKKKIFLRTVWKWGCCSTNPKTELQMFFTGFMKTKTESSDTTRYFKLHLTCQPWYSHISTTSSKHFLFPSSSSPGISSSVLYIGQTQLGKCCIQGSCLLMNRVLLFSQKGKEEIPGCGANSAHSVTLFKLSMCQEKDSLDNDAWP